MEGFVPDTRARDAVRAFLAGVKGEQAPAAGASSSSEDEGLTTFRRRPPLAGIGAEFEPESWVVRPVVTEAERRLRGALRKEREADDDDADAKRPSSDEEGESRAAVLGRRKRRKKRRRSAPQTPDPAAVPTMHADNGPGARVGPEEGPAGGTSAAKAAGAVAAGAAATPAKSRAPGGGAERVPEVAFVESAAGKETAQKEAAQQQAAEQHAGSWRGRAAGPGLRPRKKRKIRSRQKNLRRDTRPRDQLPAHLTEETLRGGRVRRAESAGGAEGATPSLS